MWLSEDNGLFYVTRFRCLNPFTISYWNMGLIGVCVWICSVLVCVCVVECVCARLCLHQSLSSCCVCVCVLWLSFPVCSRVTQTVPLLPSLEAGPDQLPPRPHCQSIWPIPCCHLPSVIVFGQFRAAI